MAVANRALLQTDCLPPWPARSTVMPMKSAPFRRDFRQSPPAPAGRATSRSHHGGRRSAETEINQL